MRRWGLLLLISVQLTGCERYERVLGTIEHDDLPVQIETPERVARGEPFEVSVVTYFGGCLQPGSTEVTFRETRVEVTPWDRRLSWSLPTVACTDDFGYRPHVVSIRLHEPGPVTIAVRGLRKPGNQEITAERVLRVE